jgi:predicted RecA/RadA family phage recombinase
MADIALVTANRVEVVGIPVRQLTLAAGEDITAGAPVTINSTGKFVNADGNGSAPLNTCKAICTRTVKSGQAVTGIAEGVLDGYDVSGSAYGDKLYLSDTVGRIATGTGTANLDLGYVMPATGQPITSGHDKVFAVNIRP